MASLDAAEDDPRRYGEIFKVAGPLVVAAKMSGAFMHELVRVGTKRIVVRRQSFAASRFLPLHFAHPLPNNHPNTRKLTGGNY